ncbi:hypothetical protein [Corynebacterium flavescens]|uniref:hypothetical protein n=1 Tax=Corynebacterium flavescens TaxID=28028 RepID=UPI003FD34C49
MEQIPAHWEVVPFRHVFTESREVNGENPVGPMLSVSGYRGVEIKEYDSDNRRRTPEEVATYRVVRQGQLAVNTMWLNYAGLGVSAIEGHMSPAYRAYDISRALEPRYVHHLLRSSIYVQGYTALLTGIRPNSLQMSRDDLMSFPVIVPPLEDQRLIADYLDRETAEIDAFIADLDDYSTLLSHRLDAERDRTFLALLDSSNPVPLKRWLKIPLSYGATAAANHFDPGEVRYLRITDFGAEGDLRPEVATSLPYEAAAGYMTAPGDILLARSGATVGKAFMVPDSLPEACFAGYLVRARCQNRVEASFVWHALQTTKYKDWIAANATVATIQNVSAQKFGTHRIPRPSLAKQSEVIEELDRVQKNIDASQALSAEARTLAVERRAALISAAVTGQIDVTAQGVSAAEQLRDELEVHV